MNRKKIIGFFIVLTILLPVFFCNAQESANGTLRNPLGGAGGVSGVTTMINGMIKVVLGFTGLLALISFIYGGILWMISYGDSNKIKKGQEVMKWSVFGLTVIFASYAIVMTLFEFMGIGGTAK